MSQSLFLGVMSVCENLAQLILCAQPTPKWPISFNIDLCSTGLLVEYKMTSYIKA